MNDISPSTAAPGAGRWRQDALSALSGAADLVERVPPSPDSTGEARSALLASIRGHLTTRLRHPGLRPLVAVAGLGGTGKSHTVNQIVGQQVTPEGPLRPTTRTPVVVTSGTQVDEAWTELLGAMRRLDSGVVLVDAPRDEPFPGILIDLPPGGAGQPLLELADICLVVTTPGRYGDAATWELVDDVVHHGVEQIVVLNRATGTDDEVAVDLSRRLDAVGVTAPLVCVTTGGGIDELVEVLHRHLDGDHEERSRRLVASTATRIDDLAAAVEERVEEERTLVDIVDRITAATADEMRRSVEERPMPGAADHPWSEPAERLAGVVTHRIGDAASAIASEWEAEPLGASLLEDGGGALWRHPADASLVACQALLAWPAAVERLVVADARRTLRPHVLDALVETVRARALGSPNPVSRRMNRKLQSGVDEVAGRARTALADITGDLVAADRSRYLERLGGGPEPSLPAALRRSAEHLRRTVSADAARTTDPGDGTDA